MQSTALEGNQRNSNVFQIGFDQQTTWGMSQKIYYNLDQSEITGADSSFVPSPSTSRSSFNYEFSFSLWRNALGASTKNQVSSLTAQNKSEEKARLDNENNGYRHELASLD